MLGLKNINKLTTDTDIISELATKPTLSAQALKAKFDEGNTALKTDINAAIDALNANIEIINSLMNNEEISKAIDEKVTEVGSGDMSKSVYDSNGDGIVDNSERLDGKTISEILNIFFPVGSVKLTTNNINPSTYLGGTWVAWGQGRVPVGIGTIEQNTNNIFGTLDESELALTFVTPEAKSGKYFHTLTENQLPKIEGNIGFHYSDATNVSSVSGAFSSTKTGEKYRNGGTEGGGATSVGAIKMSFGNDMPHNNMPPYITCYMWKRTA
jgi:microcystin-dependent protein